MAQSAAAATAAAVSAAPRVLLPCTTSNSDSAFLSWGRSLLLKKRSLVLHRRKSLSGSRLVPLASRSIRAESLRGGGRLSVGKNDRKASERKVFLSIWFMWFFLLFG